MALIGWYVIVPFCLASLVSGLYKPWGLIPCGLRKRDPTAVRDYAAAGTWRLYLLLGIIGLVLVALLAHLINGGPRHH
jgi:hypothetical protein